MPARRASLLWLLALAALIALAALAWRASSKMDQQQSTATIQNAAYDVQVEYPRSLTVGETIMVRVHVARDGVPVDLNGEGRLLHVIIVSADIGDIFHTFGPTPEGVGVFSVEHKFTRPGRYRVWTEIDNIDAPQRHDEHAEHLAYVEFAVGGRADTVVADTATEVQVGPYHIHLTPTVLRAGEAVPLQVIVHDESKQPEEIVALASPEPFLYAMSGENFSFFRHGHGGLLPSGEPGLVNTFPAAGRYIIWMELQLENGDSVGLPFIVRVS